MNILHLIIIIKRIIKQIALYNIVNNIVIFRIINIII